MPHASAYNEPDALDYGYYDARQNGIVANSEAAAVANREALQTLLDTIRAGGDGARIHFPAGDYYIACRQGVSEENLASIRMRGHNNITFSGDGMEATRIIWSGDLTSSTRYMFWIAGASLEALANITAPATTENITFRDLWIGVGTMTNWSPTDQNHLVRLYTEKRGDVKNVSFLNVGFGVVKGDAINLNGERNATTGALTYVDGVLVQGCVFDGYKYAGTNPGWGYRCCIAHQRMLKNLRYIGNRFTGSDDSLLDFEPTGGLSGSNGISRVSIVGNTFVASSPISAASAPECVSFGGNDEVEGGYLSDLEFVGNTVVNGIVRGLRVTRADISHNTIYAQSTGVLTTSAIYFIDRVESLRIHGNFIWCPSAFPGNAAIEIYNEALPANEESATLITDNVISVAGCTAILAESCDLLVAGNRIINKSAAAAQKIAVSVRATSNDSKVQVVHNSIVGDLGGGTFEFGITLWCDDNDMQAIASSNLVRGCSTGLRFVAASGGGTYTPMPVAQGNSFTSCTTNMTLGSGVFVVIGGNAGDVTLTIGGNVTPEAAVTAIQGSRHVRKNGDSTTYWYKSTGTGTNTGWVQETMP